MAEWTLEASLAALFSAAFISATVLPGGSEVVLVKFLLDHPAHGGAALAVATVGNTLGSMTTYLLGRLFPARLESPRAARATLWLRRYGAPALLLAWLPLVGDALCGAAGWLRISWMASLAFIAAGKAARYAAIAAGVTFI
jgi:membrane protein YqaA with SNARE-associated domain